MEEWKGTQQEQKELVSVVLAQIKEEHFSEMSNKDFNKIFAEAFCRNMVQSELIGMMLYRKEDEGAMV